MKIIPIALNHLRIQLANGDTIDINDGTLIPRGELTVKLYDTGKRRMIIATSITYDGAVRLSFEEKQ